MINSWQKLSAIFDIRINVDTIRVYLLYKRRLGKADDKKDDPIS